MTMMSQTHCPELGACKQRESGRSYLHSQCASRPETLPQQTVLKQILLSLGSDRIKGLLPRQFFFLLAGATEGKWYLSWSSAQRMSLSCLRPCHRKQVAINSSHKHLYTENCKPLLYNSNFSAFCLIFLLYFKTTSSLSFHKYV